MSCLNLQLGPSCAVALQISTLQMILNSDWFIMWLFARLQTRWNALDDLVKNAVVEKGTAISVFVGGGADDSVHG